MASIKLQTDIDLDDPMLIEGLPGVGLVGKIATDHLIDTFDMTYYASVQCGGLPSVAVYRGDDSVLRPPVRLYADAERDLLVLHSDVPISSDSTETFASCIVDWIAANGITPLFLSGLPEQGVADGEIGTENSPELFGVATGDGISHLDREGIVPPRQSGLVSGPTGALLHEAIGANLTGVGLIVEANPQFPDPKASRVLLEHGISPIADIDIDTTSLIEQAEEIREARERFAKRMQQAQTEESSQAQPLRGFQ
ncbi:proteasome assembly chaperone family protein [Halocatena marina]|uniref:proteasome assembly chaperone family protein n=1 Tax=Halocatena marina TaxID=2934937 RepID=UPI00200F97D0|nr:PAC2 family protein [Halocatena marina]